MENMKSEYRVEMTGITKSFGVVSVLEGVDLKIK